MKRPFRVWMTGCFAVVMSAIGGGRADATERGARGRDPVDARVSRFSADETVERLESSAARHGFSVFARVDAAAGRHGEAAGSSMIVFESSRGGTPVLMEGPDSRPNLPLSVRVQGTTAGASEVWITDSGWDDLPDELARELIELPALVDDALA